ncbi:hypothetical protein RF11_03529 [Thelohanellus kitauei]|uniref:Tc1-like transposase DDE domain-containing protein n=1 Tax=Thelohanellus kitauei TaxID=669202 RepID=A0A0C2JC22_THEKT|nr:hypothetical protein RF11_03529 [Thelohanellus kitauei]
MQLSDASFMRKTFSRFLRRLVAVLGEGDFTIVMDNVRFHQTAVKNIDHFLYDVKFLPRYSPFFNPCEEAFSGVPQGTNDLIRRMAEFCVRIPVNSLSNFVAHSEYLSNKYLNLEDLPRDWQISNKLSIS